MSKFFTENVNHQGYVASVSKNKTYTIDDFVNDIKNQNKLIDLIN